VTDLSITVNGMKFDNPFVLGSGPPGTNGLTQSTFDLSGASLCTTMFGSAQVGSWICEHRTQNFYEFRHHCVRISQN